MWSFGLLLSNLFSSLKKLSPTFWLAALLGIVLCGGYLYHEYALHEAYDNGHADGYLIGKKEEKESYEKILNAERNLAQQATTQQKREQERIVNGLESKLADAQAQLDAKPKTIIKEVKTYVTAKADAAAIIPAGFVYYHDLSTTTIPDSVAGSKPNDVDAPTAVTLSDIATVDAENNAECQFRSQVIDSWIEWYQRNKVLWENTINLQQQKIVVH